MLEPVQLFKCLADENRLGATLLILLEGELCVCELMEALSISQPKISRHLGQLRNYGILNDVRRGHWVYYSISTNLPAWAMDVLTASCQSNQHKTTLFQNNLKAMQNRPNCC
jgi:ArsR family transcriptional regulator